MRISTFILTGLLAGIYSSVLDGIEQDYSLNSYFSAFILALLTIGTGLLLHRLPFREKSRES
ncbi:hypothetical protein [Rossellomorea vietnamensis]|uniref:Uncharacterized protein n=1 Tax=Rossellomorea vietnamensis TaxID=218284 RepID=A0ACD4C9M4_9BACI|nr:hypothetical protein [Rossellomorea vietnamensis]UXH45114.1 hypothetical protein N5C46_03330 [Rossellomorea vietnamensis]WQI96472.1 hypothetical protein Q7C14_03445 [Rossellomorea vietnamensis]